MFTEIAASEEPSGLRIAAAGIFLISGILFFYCGTEVDNAFRRSELLQEPRAHSFRQNTSAKRQLIYAFLLQGAGWIAIVVDNWLH
jgi:hypothetical protein